MKPSQLEKKQRLLSTAIHLFMEKGIDETSVNDIVKAAHLAKGTFYVYFTDKSELIHEIVKEKNVALMRALIQSAKQDHEMNDISWPEAFLHRLIRFYQENPNVLKMIHHCFLIDEKRTLPLQELRQQLSCFDEFIESFQKQGEAQQTTLNRFLIIPEMCAIVCYNAIFFQQPASLDEIKEMFISSMCESFACGQGGNS